MNHENQAMKKTKMIYETGEIITTEIYRVSPEEKDELDRLSAERIERLREEAIPNIRKRYEQLVQLSQDKQKVYEDGKPSEDSANGEP